jgi:hypothetical protein
MRTLNKIDRYTPEKIKQAYPAVNYSFVFSDNLDVWMKSPKAYEFKKVTRKIRGK